MKPEFICAGFAKCGTTTLHEILKQHKNIYLPLIKEPIYFGDLKAYNKGFNWYCKRYYPKTVYKKKVGEVNMAFTMKNVVSQVYKDFGKDLKFIFIMRNPVDRLYSEYKYATRLEVSTDVNEKIIKHYTNSQRFDKMVKRHLKCNKEGKEEIVLGSYGEAIRGGNYFECIEKYLKFYPIENMKFVFFEDFIRNKEEISKEIFEFLGVTKEQNINYNIWLNEGNRIGKSDRHIKFFRFFCDYIWNFYILNIPFVSENFTSIMLKIYNKIFYLLTKEDKDKSKITDKTREKLENYYLEDKIKLEKLLNRDLSKIWF